MTKRKNRKEERKRRLLFLIMLLLLTVAIGATATYAWFTSNKTVTIEPMDVEVSAVNGLQISVDAINWKAKITKDELTGADATYGAAKNQLPDIFGAVSTSGSVSSGKLNMYYGTVTANETTGKYQLTTAAQTEEIDCTGTTNGCAGKYYAAFDIFLKVDQNIEVFLDQVSNVVTTGSENRGVQNASRVAFVVEGHGDNGADPSAIQGSMTGSAASIWEPNYNMHTASGCANASSVYSITGCATDGTNNRFAYKGVNGVISTPVAIDATDSDTHFSSVTVAYQSKGTPEGPQSFMTLQRGVTKIRVYWWIEGQDVDAENNATGTQMQLKLSFSIN